METELSLVARQRAGEYFKQGYNCAESVFLALQPWCAPELDPALLRIATPFGGGLGRSGCLCGALTGATMMLGMLAGRTTAEQSRQPAYALSQELCRRFSEAFGSTCCRTLVTDPFGSPEQGRACLKIVGNTARLFMEFAHAEKLL